MRILIAVDSLGLGGTERVTVMLANALVRHPDVQAVGVATLSRDITLASALSDNVQVHLPPLHRETMRLRHAIVPLLRFARLSLDGYTVVIGASPHAHAIYALAGVGRPQRLVAWVHLTYGPYMRRSERDWVSRVEVDGFLRHCRDKVFISRGTAQAFPADPVWRPGRRCIIRNPFDLAAYRGRSTTADRVRQIRARGLPVLGTVSRASPEKALHRLLAVHAELRRIGKPHSTVFIGDGPCLPALMAAAATLPDVHFLGADPHPLEAIGHMDVFGLCSEFEGWPTTLLEALSQGVPVVAHDCPNGPADMLQGPLSYMRVPFNDPVAFAHRVAQMPRLAVKVQHDAAQLLASVRPAQVADQWVSFLQGTDSPRA